MMRKSLVRTRVRLHVLLVFFAPLNMYEKIQKKGLLFRHKWGEKKRSSLSRAAYFLLSTLYNAYQ
jgi:hypothetical protein